MSRRLRFNALEMNCLAHQSPGFLTIPGSRSRQQKDIGYRTDLAGILVPELQKRGIYPRACRPGILRENLLMCGDRLSAPHPAAAWRDLIPAPEPQFVPPFL